MKNISKNVVSKTVWGLVMGLFLAGPVFGNEPVAAPVNPEAKSDSVQVDAPKPEVKAEKKALRRKHKHSKKVQSPEASPAPVVK